MEPKASSTGLYLEPDESNEQTPWRKDFLEKLTVTQLVKKSPAFYGTQSFITFATGPYPEADESN
jgi:hypothetical protein